MLSDWPAFHEGLVDETAIAEIDWVIRLVSAIRTVRTEMNVAPGAQIPAALHGAGEITRRRLDAYRDLVARLARLSEINAVDGPVAQGAGRSGREATPVASPRAAI